MDCREIERSIITTYRKEIWSRFAKGVKEFDLAEEGDKIAVCISGGKDFDAARQVHAGTAKARLAQI